jgi:hypothetical protein
LLLLILALSADISAKNFVVFLQHSKVIFVTQFTIYDLQFTIREVMAIKIENASSIKLPKNTEQNIEQIFKFLPIEHLRGIDKIKLVDFIDSTQLRQANINFKGDLPGLYHPKIQGKAAWLEVSTGALLKPTESYFNRLIPKMQFKANLAGLIFSLVGQHYFLTMRHSIKKDQYEKNIRQYTEKNLRAWSEKQAEGSFRAKLFKPLRPYIEKWAKSLNKKALNAQKKSK